jgi:hypothetical protein
VTETSGCISRGRPARSKIKNLMVMLTCMHPSVLHVAEAAPEAFPKELLLADTGPGSRSFQNHRKPCLCMYLCCDGCRTPSLLAQLRKVEGCAVAHLQSSKHVTGIEHDDASSISQPKCLGCNTNAAAQQLHLQRLPTSSSLSKSARLRRVVTRCRSAGTCTQDASSSYF